MPLRTSLAAASLAGILLATTGAAQLSPARPTWSRTFGGPVSEQGLHDVRQLPGGRLVVAGHSASFGGPSTFNWLMNLDLASGDVRFQQASSSASGGFTDGAAIAADGGALFLGRNVLDILVKHDAWLVRVDAGGGPVWSRGFTSAGTGKHFLHDAAELADGSWIAVGSISATDQPPQAAWVVRLAPDGAPLWQFRYGAGAAETAKAVTPTLDGGFAVAGWTSSTGAGSDDAWVLKIDATGAIEWQKTFGGPDADQAEDIVEFPDGSLAVVGSTNSLTPSGHAPWVLRVDAAGTLLWHRVIGDVWGDLGGAARTEDGQLLVVGRVGQTGFPTNDLWSAKLDLRRGTVLWQRAYEGELGDLGSAALPLAGAGSGLLLGGTWGWGFPGESVWLQRTDPDGDLPGCNLVRTTKFPAIRPAIVAQDGAAVRSPGGAQPLQVGAQSAPSDTEVIDVCR